MQHSNTDSCILLKFYIKPQPETTIKTIGESCILLKFYIKPQQGLPWIFFRSRCILLKFYIKPQLCEFGTLHGRVVSYWNSTSNHNFVSSASSPTVLYLIEILHQTTTESRTIFTCRRLYLIEILHQTTTQVPHFRFVCMLYLIEILHQTTTDI